MKQMTKGIKRNGGADAMIGVAERSDARDGIIGGGDGSFLI